MKRRFSHITPRYIKDRLLVWCNEVRRPEDPWLTKQSVEILRELLRSDDVGVEFGSGRSTIWFAKRIRYLTSIESDAIWYDKVRDLIRSEGLASTVDYRKCDDDEEYARQATLFDEGSLDFCLVDGLVRDRCALKIIPKIKSGGILVVDNINWYLPNDFTVSPDSMRTSDGPASKDWVSFEEQVSSWRSMWTSNGVTDTCIWLKP